MKVTTPVLSISHAPQSAGFNVRRSAMFQVGVLIPFGLRSCVAACVGLLAIGDQTLGQQPELLPSYWFENVQATDGSTQSSLVFRTVPGVAYTVEFSSNLSDWTELDSIYGLGYEFVTAMRQFSPPPTEPPPGDNPPPEPAGTVQFVSLRMQPADDLAGGTVVSWPSLEGGGAMIVRIPETLVPEWSAVPLFFERYGAFSFFASLPSTPIPPPLLNPDLGGQDAEMLATLQANFQIMNQLALDNAARSRNAPPPAPPDPDAHRFWRIKADWGLDSDLDGSPDWVEFAAAANPAGIAGLRADAFDADTDANNIADGAQLDYDGDGTCDAQDIKLAEKAVSSVRVPMPRYGYFPITNAEPPQWNSEPFQINDKGTVLYRNGVWRGGAWQSLALAAPGLNGCEARAINDSDVILGLGEFRINTNPEQWATTVIYWPTPNGAPFALSATLEGSSVRVVPSYNFANSLLHPGPVLSHDGRFIMPSCVWVDETQEWASVLPSVWTLPQGNVPLAEQQNAGDMQYIEGGVTWGNYPDPEDFEKPLLHAQAGTTVATPLPLWAKNVFVHPNGAIFALSANGSVSGLAFIDGTWQKTAYAQAVDISADGTAIGRNHNGFTAPIMQNGNWRDIMETTPDLPAGLRTSTLKLIDTTACGWVLAEQIPEEGIDRNAVMLPLKLEGRWTDPGNVILTEAVGVDDFSIGSTNPGIAVSERLWIMAPLGGAAASAVLRAPLNANAPLTLSSDFLNLGDPDGTKTIATSENPFTLAAKPAATTGMATLLKLQLRDIESKSKPIGVKIMKARTIKVNVIRVSACEDFEGTLVENPPSTFPLREALTAWLNRIFEPQLNATFEIAPYANPISPWVRTNPDDPDSPLRRRWDIAPTNGALDVDALNTHSAEQAAIVAAVPAGTPEANITVYLLGGDKMIKAGTHNAFGLANREQRTAWVMAESISGRQTADVAQAIAHEIGHILVGYGHPDENAGPARLPGTDHKKRLMRSGDAAGGTIATGHLPGNLLVKPEWDEAETWFQNEEVHQRMPQ